MNTAARKEKRPRAQRRRAIAEAKKQPITLVNANTVWFFAIFGSALLLRLIYLTQIKSIPLFYHLAGDGWTYDEWGQRIAAGAWLGDGVFYQAPLYPYFLGVLQFLFGHSLWLVRIVQITLGSVACALIFLIGQKLFSRRAGIAASLILACYAPAIFFDGLIEKSVLDLFLLTALLFILFGVNGSEGWRHWIGAGVVLGLLGLSRENALILVPVVALWIGLFFSGRSPSTRARWLGLFFAGLLLVLVPVGLRNLAVGGEFALTTSQFGPNFFIGNNAAADGTYGSVRKVIRETQLEGPDAKRLAERAVGHELSSGEVSSYWFNQSLDYIKSRPAEWLRLLGLKWLLVWNAREIEDSDDFYIYQGFSSLLAFFSWFNHFGILAPLAVLGVWLTRSQWRRLWLLHVMIVALALSITIFYVFGRYRFPLVPLLILFAGAGVVEAARLYKERAWPSITGAVAIILITATVVNWPLRGKAGPGVEGYNNLSNAYYKQGRVDEAVSLAQKAIALAPEYGIAHYNLGNLYAAQEKFDLAQQHFEEALRLYPNYAEAHSNYGQLLAERGDLESGTRYFQRAVALNPELSRAQLNLGVALAKQGRTEEAIGPLQEAVRLSPDSPEASYYLGSVHAAQNRYDDAAKFFQQALRIQPDFVPAHQSLAQLLALQGKTAEAKLHYQEAIRLMKRTRPAVGVR
ncbi:MAG: tetratricopeptide repeat protein [Candidatus Binatia bacterium]